MEITMQYYKHPIRRPVSGPCEPVAAAVKPPFPPEGISSNPMTGFPLAMAYVPYQTFDDLNDPCKALSSGTLFRALYMPFQGQKRGGV